MAQPYFTYRIISYNQSESNQGPSPHHPTDTWYLFHFITMSITYHQTVISSKANEHLIISAFPAASTGPAHAECLKSEWLQVSAAYETKKTLQKQ